jgi:hypothetical protein
VKALVAFCENCTESAVRYLLASKQQAAAAAEQKDAKQQLAVAAAAATADASHWVLIANAFQVPELSAAEFQARCVESGAAYTLHAMALAKLCATLSGGRAAAAGKGVSSLEVQVLLDEVVAALHHFKPSERDKAERTRLRARWQHLQQQQQLLLLQAAAPAPAASASAAAAGPASPSPSPAVSEAAAAVAGSPVAARGSLSGGRFAPASASASAASASVQLSPVTTAMTSLALGALRYRPTFKLLSLWRAVLQWQCASVATAAAAASAAVSAGAAPAPAPAHVSLQPEVAVLTLRADACLESFVKYLLKIVGETKWTGFIGFLGLGGMKFSVRFRLMAQALAAFLQAHGMPPPTHTLVPDPKSKGKSKPPTTASIPKQFDWFDVCGASPAPAAASNLALSALQREWLARERTIILAPFDTLAKQKEAKKLVPAIARITHALAGATDVNRVPSNPPQHDYVPLQHAALFLDSLVSILFPSTPFP